MTIRTAFLSIAAAIAAISIYLGNSAEITDPTAPSETNTDGLHISLLTDEPEELTFSPGASIPINARVKNEGTEDARVFISLSIPVTDGAVLTDGTENPEVLSFDVGDGWEEIEDGVYFYEKTLLPGQETTPLITDWTIPDYDLHSEEGSVMTGELTMDEISSLMSQTTMKAHAIMTGVGDDPQQLWEMVGGTSEN